MGLKKDYAPDEWELFTSTPGDNPSSGWILPYFRDDEVFYIKDSGGTESIVNESVFSRRHTKYYSLKSTNYTITNTDDQIIYTTTGGIIITLPASPIDGLYIDVCHTGNGKITIDRNGNNINGKAKDIKLLQHEAVTLHYTTSGWFII